MADAIRLGRMTDTMEEGFIAELNIKIGDQIKPGDVLAEVETDKATLPLESYYKGQVLHIAVKKGDTLKMGELIAILGKPGEDFSSLLNPVAAAAPITPSGPIASAQAVASTASPSAHIPAAVSTSESRIKASPLAKSLAREKGIDISSLKGSGEEGRIVKRDVEQVGNKSTSAVPLISGSESYRDERLSQMRKTIARRLSQSMQESPHFYLTSDIRMDEAIRVRTQINEARQEGKISFNDLVIKAVAAAIRMQPGVNCSWHGDFIRYHNHIHIGMAVAVPDGLVVPVINHADQKSLSSISAEARDLASKASSRKLSPSDMEGNTFTISNLGMFGIDSFTAVINPPDACILAVGAIREEPGVVNGEVKVVSKMKVTLSCDHRAVDGAMGASFLKELKRILENPALMLY
jgi:pyruvate dehydrogenase E2 component (dihydrolipoamide acetyltransferase)